MCLTRHASRLYWSVEFVSEALCQGLRLRSCSKVSAECRLNAAQLSGLDWYDLIHSALYDVVED